MAKTDIADHLAKKVGLVHQDLRVLLVCLEQLDRRENLDLWVLKKFFEGVNNFLIASI